MWDYTHLSFFFFFALHQDNMRLLKYFCLLTITAANRRGRNHRVELREVLLYKSITQNNNKSFCFGHPTLKKINLQLCPLVISPSASVNRSLIFSDMNHPTPCTLMSPVTTLTVDLLLKKEGKKNSGKMRYFQYCWFTRQIPRSS